MSGDKLIQLAHGGGGWLTRELIESEIVARFGNGPLRGLPDGATLPSPRGQLVFTTDSFVVQPLEFPGGNIGHLAVHGTVNDIAVCGGVPLWLSLALIIEEGLPFAVLARVLDSVRSAADACGVTVATGDTKVVARGQGDGLYVNTAGIGQALPEFALSRERIREGDCVLVNGPLADHGLAVLAARQNIGFVNGPQSDTAPIHRLVLSVRDLGASVRFMRDPTRGGAAAVLNEIVGGAGFGILMRERDLPLNPATRAVSEMLGIDPLHVASEGRVILICAAGAAPEILRRWHAMPEGAGAACLGVVTRDNTGRVVLETLAGGRRLVDVPRGELLPRIC
ncbi:MAG TPA: hydrogenase expression/formation protein HypE [Kiritimatiellia bacterium]|nr:hydrogenase expression/formation protein HypE [Kiritimatiellia bacterium]HPS07442.1 hydrogenase expression/formation protein HypE [Kiritimatiellia bacterium]